MMSKLQIVIDQLSELPNYERHIKDCCADVQHVFHESIYFFDINNPHGAGLYISFRGFPNEPCLDSQAMFLRAINAACNTNFILRSDL